MHEPGVDADVEPLPEIYTDLPALRRDHPWPELPVGVDPFYLSLDGGGRELITDVICDRGITLMVEIGCFLCGSTRQWLDASPDLTVIGVDPWGGNWSVYLRQLAAKGNPSMKTLPDPLATAVTIQRHGNYLLALNNIRDHRERFIPVRQNSPDALHYLRERRVRPQLIYIDATKREDELWVANELFPKAILCGDDWNWPNDQGRFQMQEHVQRFVDEHGFSVEARAATWLITKPSDRVDRAPSLPWDEAAAQELMREAGPLGRDVIVHVAERTQRGSAVSLSALAHELDSTAPTLLELIKAVNNAPVSRGRHQVLGLADGEEGAGLVQRPLRLAPELVVLLA